MLNNVTLIGYLGKDPEIKQTTRGNQYAMLSIATSKRTKDKETEEVHSNTEWHRIVVWRETLVNICKDYLRKGSKIYLEGELKTRKYIKNGETRFATEVVMSGPKARLVMLDRKDNSIPDPEDQDCYGQDEVYMPEEGTVEESIAF